MIQRLFVSAIGCLAIGLAGCSEGGPVEVSAHDGPAMRMAGLGGTYAWVSEGDSAVQNPEIHSLLTETIDGELAKKGFSKSDVKSAAFWIAYRVTRENKTDASVNPHGVTYPRGTLIVWLLDPATRKTIWASSATAKLLANAPPAERSTRVQESIHKMLNLMPPK